MNELVGSYQDILDIPTNLPDVESKRNHIVERIIPAMNIRRGRTYPLSAGDVAHRLWSKPASDKPGEEYEFFKALTESGDELFTPEMALEVADYVYYSLQPNAPDSQRGSREEELEMFDYLFVGNMELTCDFCILKYETRLKYGDLKEYEFIERQVMVAFFQAKNLPESLIQTRDQ